MQLIHSAETPVTHLTGRNVHKIIEAGGVYHSENMSLGIAEFSTEIGPMQSHHHDEEGIYVIEAKNAFTRCGASRETLGERMPVAAGDVLLYFKDEEHIFEFEEDGYLKIVFFFASGDFKRPE